MKSQSAKKEKVQKKPKDPDTISVCSQRTSHLAVNYDSRSVMSSQFSSMPIERPQIMTRKSLQNSKNASDFVLNPGHKPRRVSEFKVESHNSRTPSQT